MIRPHGLPAQDRREVIAAGEAVALDQGTGTRAGSARGRGRVARLWRVAARWRLLGPLATAALAGLALDAAFAPLGWWPIAIPAAALVILVMRGRTWRQALLLGFAVGVAQFAPLVAWLTVVTPIAWIALTLAQSAYIAVLGVGLAVVVRRVPAWPMWAALLWVPEELVRTRWPLDGFGWGRLAFSQPDTPFTGYAAIAGAPLVTFAVALSAAFLAAGVIAALEQQPREGAGFRRFVPAIGALVVAIAVSIAGVFVPRPTDGPTLQVALVQGNVPHPGTHFLGRAEQVLDNHVAETRRLADGIADGSFAQPDIVLWPENASDVDPFAIPSAFARIQAATRSVGAPILVGAVLDAGPDHATNTGIVWDPTTGPGERYSKRHLVPFGEYIPWRGFVKHLTSLTTLVPRNFVPGHGSGALDIGPTRVADVICFEVSFDDVVRSGVTHGGRLIVVQTNNATYMGTAETRQQLAMSQLRAVEHGRSVVVVSTSGISAVIAPDGRVVAQTKEMTPAIVDLPVVQRSQLTLADHLGAAPEWAMGILGLLGVILGLVIRRRAGGSSLRRS